MGSVIQEDANSAGTIASRATVISAKTLRKRRIASIFQHYYPEGGWGYVILLCGFLVQIFTHGLQLSFGIFLPIIFHRFHPFTSLQFPPFPSIRLHLPLFSSIFRRLPPGSNRQTQITKRKSENANRQTQIILLHFPPFGR